jgi:hypothetical protein
MLEPLARRARFLGGRVSEVEQPERAGQERAERRTPRADRDEGPGEGIEMIPVHTFPLS